MRYKLMTAAFAAAAAMQFSAPAKATDLEVIHWWTSKGESRAVAEFAKAFACKPTAAMVSAKPCKVW